MHVSDTRSTYRHLSGRYYCLDDILEYVFESGRVDYIADAMMHLDHNTLVTRRTDDGFRRITQVCLRDTDAVVAEFWTEGNKIFGDLPIRSDLPVRIA